MMFVLMWWPFKKYISVPIRLFDGSAVLKFNQTDIQTIWIFRLEMNSHYCAWSAAYFVRDFK